MLEKIPIIYFQREKKKKKKKPITDQSCIRIKETKKRNEQMACIFNKYTKEEKKNKRNNPKKNYFSFFDINHMTRNKRKKFRSH